MMRKNYSTCKVSDRHSRHEKRVRTYNGVTLGHSSLDKVGGSQDTGKRTASVDHMRERGGKKWSDSGSILR